MEHQKIHQRNTNETLTDTNTKKEKKENKEKEGEEDEATATTSLLSISELSKSYLSNNRLCNAVINNKKNKIKDLPHLVSRVTEFSKELEQRGTFMKSEVDFNTHFRNWHLKTVNTTEDQTSKHQTDIIPLAK